MKCYADLWQVLMQAEPLELQWLKSLERSLWVEVDKLHLHYIYIYAFSRRFYPKRLTVHSSYTFFYQYV